MPNRLNMLMEKELAQLYPAGTDFLVVGYNKLSGQDTTGLRSILRQKRAHMQTVKNSIATRVLASAGAADAAQYLQGPSAIVTAEMELPELCKLVSECVKTFEEKIFVRGGFLGGAALTSAEVSALASIPPLAVLRAQILGGIQAPLVHLASVFQGLHRSIACVLDGIRKQKEGQTPPSVPQTDASEAAPADGA